MGNKYYTPTIDEFYVGFEYVYNVGTATCPNWQDSFMVDEVWQIQDIQDELLNYIKVKYLDKTDIESLGFVDLGSLWFFKEKCLTVNGENFLNCKIRKWNGTQIDVYVDYNDTDELQLIFRGSIKNKSELVKLLKMLGIND